MTEQANKTASGGIGVTGLLGVLFIALKLLGVIDWSWWWVTAPLWGPVAFVLFLLLCVGVVVLLAKLSRLGR